MKKHSAGTATIAYQRETRQVYILRNLLFAGAVTLTIGALFAF